RKQREGIGENNYTPIGENNEDNNTVFNNTKEYVVVVNPFDFYQQNFGVLKPFVSEEIGYWIDDLGKELVIEAMKRALKQQKQWNYAEGILREWSNKGIKTIEDVLIQEDEFKRNRVPKRSNQQDEFSKYLEGL
ncbi:DnaD domain protein, partial [Halalkalibacterium halodurans]